MPKASSFSTIPAMCLPLVNAAALARTEAAANLEIMLARSLVGVFPALPHDHPDAAVGHLCATMNALRVFVDGMEEAGSPFADDDWLTDALVDRWQDAVGAVATAQPTTAAGLRLKAACVAMSIRTDARMDAGGAREGAMEKPRELALLGLLQDIAKMPESEPQPAPHAPLPASGVAGAIPMDFAAMGLHYRAGDRVSFIIPRRGARGSARLGTAIAAYATPTGFLVVVREDDGTEHRRQADAVWSA